MSEKDKVNALSFLKESATNFPERPKLVEDMLVFSMPDGLGMQFRGLSSPVVLRGALVETLLAKLLPLLDGEHNVSQLIEKCGNGAEPGDVAVLLMNLFMRGAICDPDKVSPPANIVDRKNLLFFGRNLGATRNNGSASQVAAKLARAHIVVIASGLIGASTIDLLNRSGFEKISAAALLSEADAQETFAGLQSGISLEFIESKESAVRNYLQSRLQSADLVVAVLRNEPRVTFAMINEICVQAGVQWIRACDNLSRIELGPYVNPYDSACFECMLVREISASDHAVEEELYQKYLEDQQADRGPVGESLALATQASAYLTQEAVRIISAIERPQLDGRVLNFYSDGNIDQNSFTRVPRCEVCARAGALVLPEKEHASKIS